MSSRQTQRSDTTELSVQIWASWMNFQNKGLQQPVTGLGTSAHRVLLPDDNSPAEGDSDASCKSRSQLLVCLTPRTGEREQAAVDSRSSVGSCVGVVWRCKRFCKHQSARPTPWPTVAGVHKCRECATEAGHWYWCYRRTWKQTDGSVELIQRPEHKKKKSTAHCKH